MQELDRIEKKKKIPRAKKVMEDKKKQISIFFTIKLLILYYICTCIDYTLAIFFQAIFFWIFIGFFSV